MEQQILACSKLMAEQGLTIAFAESATAGWLCSEFALAPESGSILKGGITCYDASLKESLLKVPHDLIEKFTPESQEVTDELARRLPALIAADIHVGITGLTTPGGSETAEKPVGTMFISVLMKGELFSHRRVFQGGCEDIIGQTIRATANILTHILHKSMNTYHLTISYADREVPCTITKMDDQLDILIDNKIQAKLQIEPNGRLEQVSGNKLPDSTLEFIKKQIAG